MEHPFLWLLPLKGNINGLIRWAFLLDITRLAFLAQTNKNKTC